MRARTALLMGVGVGLASLGFMALVGAGVEPDEASGRVLGDGSSASHCPVVHPGPPKSGVSFVAPRNPVEAGAVAPVARVGAGWIGILPYAFLDPESHRIHYDREGQWWGERPEGVEATIRYAREAGLRVMVKPHLWGRGMGWVGTYTPLSQEGWDHWKADYTRYILELASLSQELEVELFVVGTELDATVRERPEFWEELIAQVREVYDGALTYAANWDGYEDVPFWGELDFIGVDAYFPLSSEDTPALEELVEAWTPHLESIAELCRRFQRPVLFPEFGYRSIDGAAGGQWELPPERARDVPVNLEAQILAYEALFRRWWDLPWFAGGFLWKWFAEDDEGPSGPTRADYTPQGKPVEAVIYRWYRNEVVP